MFGFVRVGAAVPKVEVAGVKQNVEEILQTIRLAEGQGVEVLTFPELSVTGYTCGDLFYQDLLIESAEKGVETLLEETKEVDMIIAVGAPIRADRQLFNTAIVFHKGKILGIVPKTFIPNQGEFYEKRWFSSSEDLIEFEILYAGQHATIGKKLLFTVPNRSNLSIGVEICEDLWVPCSPSVEHAQAGANIILNLSASNELVGKKEYRRMLVSAHSSKIMAAYVYASSGMGESTTDLVFGGHSMIAENGTILEETAKFIWENQLIYTDVDVEKLNNLRRQSHDFMEGISKQSIWQNYGVIKVPLGEYKKGNLVRKIESSPFVPAKGANLSERCEEIFSIQCAGLSKRLMHTHTKTAVIAVSGGLDSTLALLCTAKTFDFLQKTRKEIIGITMPGFGTTGRTYDNAIKLMEALGITIREVSIKESVIQHFKDIGHDPEIHDVTYENAQARERMQIAMDVANQESGLVIGTGDLSELALGFTTYNGDHMSMYGVNGGIPKTLVRCLVDWISKEGDLGKTSFEVLQDVLNTPVSPELLPPDKNGEIHQKTEQVVGPYDLTDFFIYYFVRFGFSPAKILFLAENAFGERYGCEEILHWMKSFFRRFFNQQFKRSCIPDGPKVGTIGLSPRGDWRMPSDASSALWLHELESL